MYYLISIRISSEEYSKKGNLETKNTKTSLLVEAQSCTDAEAKAYKHMEGTISNFQVTSVKETNIEAVVK